MRVLAAAPADFAWLVERTSCAPTGSFKAIKAVDSSGRIRGMVGYDMWTVNAVQAHMAVDSPIVWRSLLRPAFAYPFEQAGKGLLLGIIPAGNARSMALTRRLRFRETYRIRDGWAAGEDLAVFEMLRDECPWLSAGTRKAA